MKVIFFILTVIISWPSVTGWCEEPIKISHSQDGVKLTDDFLAFMQKRYPGFRIAEKKDYCKNFEKLVIPFGARDGTWTYGVIKADFNGDHLDDYSVIIKFKRKYLWLAALKTNNPKSSYQITEFGPPLIPSMYAPKRKMRGKICDGTLVVGKVGELETIVETRERGFPENVTKPLNPFSYVGLENAGAAIQYYWKDGKWIRTGYEP